VPFLVRWPERVAAGSQTDRLVGQFDLMATCAELVGSELPTDAGEDSVSFLPTLLGREPAQGRTHLVSQSINGSFALREGEWKLSLCPGSGGWSEPRPGRPEHAGLPPFQLYDLAADPGETTNLADRHPDRVTTMRAVLERIIARGRSTPGPDQANDVPIVTVKPSPAPAKRN